MKRRSNINDLIEETGLSKATISRVLNDYKYVSKETKKKVISAIEKLDFRVNLNARNLARNKTNLIGVIVPEIKNPFFNNIVSRIEYIFKENNYNVILSISNDKEENEKESIIYFQNMNVDGIVLFSRIESDLSYIDDSLLLVDRYDKKINNIFMEQEKAIYDSLDYLKKKILYIYDNINLMNSQIRKKIIEKYCKEFHLTYDNLHIDSLSDYGESNILNTGVFAWNDDIALRVLGSISNHKKIEMVSCDGIKKSILNLFNVQTINQPIKEISINIVNIILQMINKEEIQQAVKLKLEFNKEIK